MRLLAIIVLFSVLFLPNQVAATVDKLVFAGKGEVNYLGFIQVYTAELYVDKGMSEQLISSPDHSKCLILHYAVSLSAEDIIKGANAVLKRQHSTEILTRLKPSIDLIHTRYQDVKEGDSYRLCYDAVQQNTTLSFNGRDVVTIDSAEFANLYFGIWLGPEAPIDESLRDSLLAALQ